MSRKEKEKAALLAALLFAMEEGQGPAVDGGRSWSGTGHPHIRSWAWNARSEDGHRLAGRFALHRGNKPGNI